MANVTIDSLPAIIGIANTDLFEVSQSLASRKIKRAELLFGPSAQNLQPAGALLSIASDGIKLQSNQLLFWDAASGSLGIGTSSPATRLSVQTGAIQDAVRWTDNINSTGLLSTIAGASTIWSTTALAFGSGLSSFTERLRIDASGKVGIGTSAPVTIFSLGGPAPKISLLDNGVYNGELGLGVLTGVGDAIGINARQATGQIVFGINSAERLRITGTGRVGINTSVPAALLHVAGAASTTALQVIGVGGNLYVDFNGLGQNYYDANTHFFRDASAAERMQIDSNGNVRIGSAALATTATNGFLYVPTCPGIPTGVPTAITGLSPLVVNSANNSLYFYSGGAWRNAGP